MWNSQSWGGDCKLSIQPDGEIWMIRDDGRNADDTRCWKTRFGDGPKLVSKFNNKVNILWENSDLLVAWLENSKTIVVKQGNKYYSFTLKQPV